MKKDLLDVSWLIPFVIVIIIIFIDCCQYYFAYHSTHIRVRELKHSIQDKSNIRLLNL